MRKKIIRAGSLMALLAVVLGAFAAHSLQEKLSPDQIEIFQTGVRYQFYHALGILLAGLLYYLRKASFLKIAAWLFVLGIVLFSGSLYLLAISEWLKLPLFWLGPVTPIGGFLFIAGWGMLFLSTFQDGRRKPDQ